MADPDRPPLRRRFVTRVDVEDAARAGQDITLGPDDVITHEAAQRAADLGMTVARPQRATPPKATGPGLRPLVAEPIPTAGPAGARGASARDAADDAARLRAAVRSAVVAELGQEPPGLDAAIDAVLARRTD